MASRGSTPNGGQHQLVPEEPVAHPQSTDQSLPSHQLHLRHKGPSCKSKFITRHSVIISSYITVNEIFQDRIIRENVYNINYKINALSVTILRSPNITFSLYCFFELSCHSIFNNHENTRFYKVKVLAA